MSIAKDIARIKGEEQQRRQMRILTIDIETRPSLAYVWSLWKENIPLDRLIEEGEIICVAAKWYDEKEVMFFSDFHDGHNEMILQVWDLLDSADIIVTYNGNRFDIPLLNTEFIKLGLLPPSPYKKIDLLQEVRKVFKFVSNKLAHVLPALSIGEKVKHSGFDLWIRCINGDPAAWEEMRLYNVGDIIGTEDLYTSVRPWISNHPNVYPIDFDDELVCPRCGCEDLISTGVVTTGMFEYPEYNCAECGGWLKGRHGTRITNLRSI